jgi:hypothetical protein
MGQLTFQATLGGAVNLAGPNTAATTTFTLPAADGSSGQALTTNGSGTLAFANIPLATAVSGTLPIANGGTNSTATATAGGVGYGTGTAHAYTAAGTAGQILQSNGASAPSWVNTGSIPEVTKTSAYTLVAGDSNKLINCTSGTFTLSFTAAATLGNGWNLYLQNSGTGYITLDPNGSETIDGLTSFIMYPNEVRQVICNGTSFQSFVLQGGNVTFTSTTTMTLPPGVSTFNVIAMGGGGGGGGGKSTATTTRTNGGGGGGGGGGVVGSIGRTYFFGATTATVTVGAGGTGGAVGASGATGGTGGTSSFATISATGGAGGGGATTNSSAITGGAGGSGTGGSLSYTGATGGRPANYSVTTGSDGGVALILAGAGGGAGAGFDTGGTVLLSTLGGAGVSPYGGAGGNGAVNVSTNAVAGSVYGGGGGGGLAVYNATTGTAGAAGAAGIVIISW